MADQTRTKIILRNGTAAQWTAKNPVLLAGEAGVESDTQRVKYGNGTTAWNDLEYAAGSKPVTATAWGEVTGTLSNQTDLKTVLDSKESTAQKGVAGGYAPLNEEGIIPVNHIPPVESFVKGMILMWSGKLEEIPTGWALCDGQEGRPNLLGKFVRGIGSAGTQPGGTGGAERVTLSAAQMPSHTHSLNPHTHTISQTHTHSGPSHTHTISGTVGDAGGHVHRLSEYSGWVGPTNKTWSMNAVPKASSGTFVSALCADGALMSRADTLEAGNHTHSLSASSQPSGTGLVSAGGNGITTDGTPLTTDAAGSGAAFSILPAYYELAYIIKL